MDRPGFADQKTLRIWADAVESRTEFPRLIRHLILETTPGIVALGMPAGEGVSGSGWDGSVRSTGSNAWVPQGLSLWELSVEKGVGAKAEADFGKRQTTPDGSPVRDATYVAGSLRRWAKRGDFGRDHSAEGKWRAVKAYGLDDIESWLETAPVTWAWISERLGLSPYGMRSAEAWWDAWSSQTDPAVAAGLVLGGRTAQQGDLRRRLATGGAITTIAGGGLDEVRAFVAAVGVHADSEDDSQLLTRMVFVNEISAWRSLLDSTTPLTLVPIDEDFASEVPSGCQHHVVVPVTSRETADIALDPIDAGVATSALREAGLVDDRRSEEAGRLARQSLTALRRKLAKKPALHFPDWAGVPVSSSTRGALLAGSWSDSSPGDREILVQLTGQQYEPLREGMRALADQEDPLLVRVGESWHHVSLVDAWILLHAQVTEDDLVRLKDVVDVVLREEDPALALPPEERWRAGLEGHVRKFSSDLRRGLSRTLALLGEYGSAITVSAGGTGANWASYIVRELLKWASEDASGQRWASLSDQLPYLAEAAPDQFVNAVRAGLDGDDALVPRLFVNTRGLGLFAPTSPHTGLLWAAEAVSWSPDHFGAAVDLLARLDAIDPLDAMTGNRPFRSLASIFCPWHPETSVGVSARLAAIDGLRERHCQTAWRLLLSMLPEAAGGVHMPIYEPRYRSWKPAPPTITWPEYFGFVHEVLIRALEDAPKEPGRWENLIAVLPNLPPDDRSAVLGAFNVEAENGRLDNTDQLWVHIRNLIDRHREFSTADWALPEAELQQLEEVASRFAPTNSCERNARLFQHGTHLGEIGMKLTDPDYDAALRAKRRDAVKEIYQEGGLVQLRELARESQMPHEVGIALADIVGGDAEPDLLPLLTSTDNQDIAYAGPYFARRFELEGWDWLRDLLDRNNDASATTQARLIAAARDFPAAWDEADARGSDVAAEYWKGFLPLGLGHDFTEVEFVTSKLIEVGRNAIALDFLCMYRRQDIPDPVERARLAVQGLDGLLATGAEDPEFGALHEWEFEQLFLMLEANVEDLGIDVVARLEWAYLPALGIEPHVPTLQHSMAASPNFYVEVVSTVYRAKAGTPEEDEPDPEREARATNGYRLLSAWSVVPGTTESDQIDSAALGSWVEEAAALLKKTDRFEVGMVHLGHVLAWAPSDPDGSWPPQPVRDLLERLQSDEVEDGLRNQILNRRGVTSRGLEDGGAQEDALVARYRGDTERFRDRWPRTAAVLRSVAESYEAESRRNENSAERFRRGLTG